MVVDPGRPFSRSFQSLINGLEDQIRYGVEQPDMASFIYKTDVSGYMLPRPAQAITRVTGLMGAQLAVFEAGYDYRFNAATNQIIWLFDPPPTPSAPPRKRPANDARFEVEFVYREQPSGLTDFNAGSVVGTLIRAIAREMKLITDQMDEAYRRAFIDQAQGAALDNVVALLGITRNPATPATGFVTFYSDRGLNDRLTIPRGTIVADKTGRRYRTPDIDYALPLLMPDKTYRLGAGRLVMVENRIAEVLGVWPPDTVPEDNNKLATEPVSSEKPFGDAGRFIKIAESAGALTEVVVRYRPRSVTVPVTAVEPGPDGNLGAGAIEVMPTPPGPVKVTNEEEIRGGQVAEPDDQLRDRAKHALDRAGRATLNAIKYAVLEVDGVEDCEVRDQTIDGTIPLGEVRVSYGGENVAEAKVWAAIEETRAAGILVTLSRLHTIYISGTIYVIPAPNAPPSVVEALRARVAQLIDALGVGEALSLRRIGALVYEVPGLADIAEAQLKSRRDSSVTLEDISGTYLTQRDERVKADEANLNARMLTGINLTPTTPNTVQLAFVDENGSPVRFTSFDIEIAIVVRARLLNQPEQPPEQVRVAVHRLALRNQTNISVNVLTAGSGELRFRRNDGLEPDPHDAARAEVIISAAAYPNLRSDMLPLTLDVS
jgi:uncharacterized phage protein gp47/JayE